MNIGGPTLNYIIEYLILQSCDRVMCYTIFTVHVADGWSYINNIKTACESDGVDNLISHWWES